MKDKIKELCIAPDISIIEAIRVLERTHERIVLVVDGGSDSDELLGALDDSSTPGKLLGALDDSSAPGKLMGVLTDSDVRKWILRNGDLNEKVAFAMTKNPFSVSESDSKNAWDIMENHGIDAVPVVDDDGILKDLIFRYDTLKATEIPREKIDVPVVIMAGGKGSRLYPYTNVLPKPLIPIGGDTILERIIGSFEKDGCSRFYLSINYKKNLIKAYFQDIAPKYSIEYVEEEDFLGTAGSLYLVKDVINETFFVSNCDILLDVDYSKVLKFHREKENAITLITSLKNYTIPYGVVKLGEDGQASSLMEKPEMNFLVNTGVYVLEPHVLKKIVPGEFMHITDLIQKCMDEGLKVGAYPVTEKVWEDMGEMVGMRKMIKDRENEG